MRSTFCIKSDNGNHYLFDRSLKIYTPISEKQHHVFQELEKNKDKANISGGGEDEHYYRKYRWMKEHGFFGKTDMKKKFSGRLSTDNLKYQLANLKQLVFEVTDSCNLNCTYCAYGHLYTNYDTRLNKKLSFEDGKKIIDYILSCMKTDLHNLSGKPLLISFYGGEPLLNFEFIRKTVEYVKSLDTNKEFWFSMTTNALLLSRHIDFLVEHNFRLLISLDGDETGNGYRVFHNSRPAYQKIKENIDFVRDKYPDYFRDSVNFNAVLHDKNDVESILRFFRKTYDKVARIAPLNNSGISEESTSEFNRMMKNIDEKQLARKDNFRDIRKDLFLNLPSFAAVSTFLIQNTGSFYNSIPDVFETNSNIRYTPTGTCIPFSKKMFISVNKKVMFCERIGHEFYAGSIDDLDQRLDEVTEHYNESLDKLEKQCRSCYMNESCSLCMYFIEDLHGKPRCGFHVSEKKYREYLGKIFTHLENNREDILSIRDEVMID